MRDAKKNLLKVTLNKEFSLPHKVEAKFSSAKVLLMPAPGRGLIAGSAIRTICEYAGIKDVNAKILSGSKNQLNIARATLMALAQLQAPKERAEKKPLAAKS